MFRCLDRLTLVEDRHHPMKTSMTRIHGEIHDDSRGWPQDRRLRDAADIYLSQSHRPAQRLEVGYLEESRVGESDAERDAEPQLTGAVAAGELEAHLRPSQAISDYL